MILWNQEATFKRRQIASVYPFEWHSNIWRLIDLFQCHANSCKWIKTKKALACVRMTMQTPNNDWYQIVQCITSVIFLIGIHSIQTWAATVRHGVFFKFLFGCPTTNFGSLSRGQPHSSNVNHYVSRIWLKGCWEPGNKVGFLSPVIQKDWSIKETCLKKPTDKRSVFLKKNNPAIWLSYSQLWAICEGIASLTWC